MTFKQWVSNLYSKLKGTFYTKSEVYTKGEVDTALSAKAAASSLTSHTGATNNPHSVTKAQVGLGNCDNTSDANKPISTATQTALDGKADLVGGKVPSSQLPSYVDDVEEYANLAAFPSTGESGKIYVALDTNYAYRWGSTTYVKINDIDLSNYYNKTEINTSLNGKVDKVSGKGLSANDFTNTLKNKLDGIASGAEVNVQSDWNQTTNSADDYIKNKPTNVSAFTNDANYMVEITQTEDNTAWATYFGS